MVALVHQGYVLDVTRASGQVQLPPLPTGVNPQPLRSSLGSPNMPPLALSPGTGAGSQNPS